MQFQMPEETEIKERKKAAKRAVLRSEGKPKLSCNNPYFFAIPVNLLNHKEVERTTKDVKPLDLSLLRLSTA